MAYNAMKMVCTTRIASIGSASEAGTVRDDEEGTARVATAQEPRAEPAQARGGNVVRLGRSVALRSAPSSGAERFMIVQRGERIEIV